MALGSKMAFTLSPAQCLALCSWSQANTVELVELGRNSEVSKAAYAGTLFVDSSAAHPLPQSVHRVEEYSHCTITCKNVII